MDSSYNENPSSDLDSNIMPYETRLSRFLSKISPSLLIEMKRYISKHKYLYEIKYDRDHRISLYEDIYSIVTLKDNENVIFRQKGKLRKVIKEIAQYTRRAHCTIDDRMRKKLYQLTPQQLAYYIETNSDIQFRGNTRIINTDEWPEHLKNQSNHVNLDSQSESQMNHISDENRRAPKNKASKRKKIGPIEESRIFSQPQVKKPMKPQMQSNHSISMSPTAQEAPIQQENFLKSPIQRQLFALKTIQSWQSKKNVRNYLQNESALEKDVIIVYNFREMQYAIINCKLISMASNELRKGEQSNNQKMRQKQVKEQKKKNVKGQRQSKSKNTMKQMHPMETINLDVKSTVHKRKTSYVDKKNPPQVIEIDDNNQVEEEFQEIQCEPSFSVQQNTQNMIQVFESFIKSTNLKNLPRQARKLLKKGVQLMDETKRVLERKSQRKSKQGKEMGQKKKAVSQKDYGEIGYSDEYDEQFQEEQTYSFNNNDDYYYAQQQQVPQQQQYPPQNINPPPYPNRKMIYWFNNDPQIYEEYQDNPYKKGYLMWCQQEDKILEDVNRNFDIYERQLEKLIKEKTVELVKRRFVFLNIRMSEEVRGFLEKQSFNKGRIFNK